MDELFKVFEELNVNKTCTIAIMYDNYLEWSITVIDERPGWGNEKVISDVYDTDISVVIKKTIENIKKYQNTY